MELVSTIKQLSREFPTNWAPFVGPIFGAYLGFQFGESDSYWFNLIYGAGVGLISGLVLFVLIHPANGIAGPTELSPNKVFWGIAGVMLAWIPIFGMIFAIVAWAINMHCNSWARTMSIIALALSALSLTVTTVYLILFST